MVGTVLGRYRIVELIGAGGMGEVYRAHDAQLQRDVAVKVLPADTADDEAARTRLLREARAAAALNHPHICTIHEVGEADGRAFIAMELVEGQPLDRLVPPGGLPIDDIVAYGLQMADAMAHAHEQGILHRDLKAANVVITRAGRLKVLDFGLAKRLRRDEHQDVTTRAPTAVTEAGLLAGTLAYMAPEQLRGEPADARSDVWALGVVLYEMAAGRRPFEGRTGFEVASSILEQPPRPLPDRVPRELQTVIDRCLVKQPLQRHQSAADLRAALEALRAGVAPALRPAPGPERRRYRRAAGGAAAAAIALVLLAGLNPGGLFDRLRSADTPPRITSVAVLPLENLSGNPEEEYFAAGVQDGLIAELARLRGLDRVIERRSTQRFRQSDAPISEIAATLGVDAVVTGSVLRAGDRVQVAAQVIHAATERHLWADRYERDAGDLLSIQNDVAAAVAAAIGIDLTPEERQRWTTRRPIDPATYEAYLRGMFLVARGPGGREDRLRGIAILQEAIQRDPGNPHAYAGLALGYVTLGHGPMATADAWPNARAAALRAVTLDPDLAEAHSALAEVRMYYEWDWEGAERSFIRANELNPNLAMNHYHYAWYHALFGRFDEAIASHKRAQELDPLTPVHTAYLGALYLYQDRPDEAIAEARKTIEFAPDAPPGWQILGAALSLKGLHDEAIPALERSGSAADLGIAYVAAGRIDDARAIVAKLEAQPPVPWSGWELPQLYAALGNYDEAFRWLAHRPAHAFLPWTRVHPTFEPLWSDPRFAELMAEMRLPNPAAMPRPPPAAAAR